MANKEDLDILAKGVDAWNEWRARAQQRPDLTNAELTLADLPGVDFTDVILSGAKLTGASLNGAKLTDAVLERAHLGGALMRDAMMGGALLTSAIFNGAVLDSANLTNANLDGARLTNASLIGANLIGANLSNTELQGANLTDAIFGSTVLGDLDLRAVGGLDAVDHAGPSTIGLDTIYRSGGKIPEKFLRGAGVPENFITYMRSLTGAALDFYSVFISYSTRDQGFADRLYADLQAKGVRCWFAPQDIQGGRKIHEQIDEAIKVYDKLLLILSDASMNSEWVKTEIANARAKEVQQKRQMLFPISIAPFDRIKKWKLFDADTGIDSAREIREYFVPDFSNWKDHDTYAKGFDLLVRSLKAGTKEAQQGA
jgi:uncharacterized protein YjbI with pentapeptide repeats